MFPKTFGGLFSFNHQADAPDEEQGVDVEMRGSGDTSTMPGGIRNHAFTPDIPRHTATRTQKLQPRKDRNRALLNLGAGPSSQASGSNPQVIGKREREGPSNANGNGRDGRQEHIEYECDAEGRYTAKTKVRILQPEENIARLENQIEQYVRQLEEVGNDKNSLLKRSSDLFKELSEEQIERQRVVSVLEEAKREQDTTSQRMTTEHEAAMLNLQNLNQGQQEELKRAQDEMKYMRDEMKRTKEDMDKQLLELKGAKEAMEEAVNRQSHKFGSSSSTPSSENTNEEMRAKFESEKRELEATNQTLRVQRRQEIEDATKKAIEPYSELLAKTQQTQRQIDEQLGYMKQQLDDRDRRLQQEDKKIKDLEAELARVQTERQNLEPEPAVSRLTDQGDADMADDEDEVMTDIHNPPLSERSRGKLPEDVRPERAIEAMHKKRNIRLRLGPPIGETVNPPTTFLRPFACAMPLKSRLRPATPSDPALSQTLNSRPSPSPASSFSPRLHPSSGLTPSLEHSTSIRPPDVNRMSSPIPAPGSYREHTSPINGPGGFRNSTPGPSSLSQFSPQSPLGGFGASTTLLSMDPPPPDSLDPFTPPLNMDPPPNMDPPYNTLGAPSTPPKLDPPPPRETSQANAASQSDTALLIENIRSLAAQVGSLREEFHKSQVKEAQAMTVQARPKSAKRDHLPFKAPHKERPRAEARTMLTSTVRDSMNKLLQLTADKKIMETLAKGHVAGPKEAERFADGLIDPPPLEPLRPCWDEPDSLWNQHLAGQFVESFMKKTPGFEGLEAEICEHFFQRVATLRSEINRNRPRGTEDRPAAAKRKEEVDRATLQIKRIRMRQVTLWKSRLRSLAEGAEEDLAYQQAHALVTVLGPDGMSSDETDGDEYLVRVLPWRARGILPILLHADNARTTTNVYGNKLPGSQPHKRVRRERLAPISSEQPTMSLPVNVYEQAWRDGLPFLVVQHLRPAPAIPIPDV